MTKTATSHGRAAAILGLETLLDEDELSHSRALRVFAQLGLSSNREERREFDRLIRNGIPFAYRSKICFERSGGLEMREPCHFTDLLSGGDSACCIDAVGSLSKVADVTEKALDIE